MAVAESAQNSSDVCGRHVKKWNERLEDFGTWLLAELLRRRHAQALERALG